MIRVIAVDLVKFLIVVLLPIIHLYVLYVVMNELGTSDLTLPPILSPTFRRWGIGVYFGVREELQLDASGKEESPNESEN